jgi:RNA polymerase sigma factor (sigma-70 family)
VNARITPESQDMASSQLAGVLQHLRRMIGPRPAAAAGDDQLLHDFVNQQDQTAFASLLERHGPMVLGVCRRVLGDAHDAEDAFQATFLVLARKAASIRRQVSVAGWLYRVAFRLAIHARAGALRGQAIAKEAVEMATEDSTPDLVRQELRQMLDEELNRLPDKYHSPITLCYLEGMSHEEAAQELRWPIGTVKGRLARARELLRQRLARRGVALPAGVSATVLMETTAPAAVPPALAAAVVEAAGLFAVGRWVGGSAVSARAQTLARGALRTMAMGRLGTALGLLVLAAGLGGGVLAVRSEAEKPQQPDGHGAAPGKPPTDSYGDPLPPGALTRLGTLRLRHARGGWVQGFTADGHYVITADRPFLPHTPEPFGNTVRLWDVESGKEHRAFSVAWIAFACNGTSLASWMPDEQEIRRWNLLSGKELARFPWPADNPITFLALSSDDRTMAVLAGAQGKIRLLDATTGKLVRELSEPHDFPLCPLVFSADGKRLASTNKKEARLWEASSGKLLRTFSMGSGNCGSLALSPDGKTLAAWADGKNDQKIHWWDVATGKEVGQADAGRVGYCPLAFSPDGKTLVAAERWWEVSTGKLLPSLPGQGTSRNDTTFGLVFSADGKRLAAGRKKIMLWDIPTGKPLGSVGGHTAEVLTAAYLPDGKTILTAGSDRIVSIWESATGKEKRRFELRPDALKVLGSMLSGRPAMKISAVGLSSDGSTLATAHDDSEVRLWDVASGKQLRELKAQLPIRSVAFAPDGRTLAGSWFVINLWDVRTGKRHRELSVEQNREILNLTYSGDGKVLAANCSGVIHLWDATSGKLIRKFSEEALSAVTCVALPPDGTTVAAGDLEGHVRIWDTATGKLLNHKLPDQKGPVVLAFSRDGRTLATGSAAGVVRLWEMATGKERRQLVGHRGPVLSLAFAPDGRTLTSGSADTTALVWDLTRVASIVPSEDRAE